MQEIIEKILTNHIGSKEIFRNEPMSNHTSFKIGGVAQFMIKPSSVKALKNVILDLRRDRVPFLVVGNGSNLLVCDEGIEGVVIKISDNLNEIEVEDTYIRACSGALLSTISNIAYRESLTGFEFAGGIPGTLGGGISMNAGAYGGELKDVLTKALLMSLDGDIFELTNGDLELSYRNSRVSKENLIVLKGEIKLAQGDRQSIKAIMDDLSEKRRSKQPINLPCAGSVFKRPEGFYAGQLVESCGLKGYAVGDAEVSTLHAGFIVNKGKASARDVITLIEHIKERVMSVHGVLLETEIKVIDRRV